MCGRVIQSSEPLAFAIVDGMDVRDSRAGLDVIRINDVEVTNGAAAETLAAIGRRMPPLFTRTKDHGVVREVHIAIRF